MEIDTKKAKNIHFIGIGGIGMSAVSQFFLSQGKNVSGSDLNSTPVTDMLENRGIKVSRPNSQNITDSINLVVYTLALDEDDVELKEAKRRKIPILSYPEILGQISKDKYTIAVSGTHGKTTTVAMTAKIMIDAGLNPTVIAGSILNEYKSNFVSGESDYFLVEACEYRRSFLELQPNVLVIANIESEHLDYYKNLEDIKSAFLELAKKLGKDDFLICNIKDPNLETVIGDKQVECNIIDYHSLKTQIPELKVPGKHNEENAKASLAVAAVFGVNSEKASKALENFEGSWRRLEKKGETRRDALVFDDYAHHPTEIKAAISSLKTMFPDKKIAIIFQPHLYSRTKLLLKEFGKSFAGADNVLLAPIYAAREKPDDSINSEMLALEIEKFGQNAKSFKQLEDIADYVNQNFDSEHIIVTIGAGDIYKLAELLTQ
jgi:UDP-N-acetylmuramate--alanine ligase